MAGGEYPDGSASKAVWRYDPTLDIWQEVESMQTPRSELGKYRLDIAWGSYRITLATRQNELLLSLLFYSRIGIARWFCVCSWWMGRYFKT